MPRDNETRRVVQRNGEKVIEITRTREIRASDLQQQIERLDREIARATQRYLDPLQQRKAAIEQQLAQMQEQE